MSDYSDHRPEVSWGEAEAFADHRVTLGLLHIGRALQEIGVPGVYREACDYGFSVHNLIRRCVQQHYPSYREDEDPGMLHPYAYAAETGLLIGALVTRESLPLKAHTEPTLDTMIVPQLRALSKLRETDRGNAQPNLDAVFGRCYTLPPAYRTKPAFADVLDYSRYFDAPRPGPENGIYAASVGFVVSALRVELIAGYGVPTLNDEVRDQMLRDAEDWGRQAHDAVARGCGPDEPCPGE